MCFYMLYVSSATRLLRPSELKDLLATSRANNEKASISGMLLYKGGNFMQLLEGDETAVRALYHRIERDPRHRGSIVLLEGTAEERQFPAWSMGFRDLSESGAKELPGYSEFLNLRLEAHEFADNPTRAQRMLLVFRERM